MTLTQSEAQHIIRKLGELGIPPTHGLESYTVGIDSLLGTLEEEYLRGYLRDGGSSFKLVVGEYGSGKSHFLYRLRDKAWESGYVVPPDSARRVSLRHQLSLPGVAGSLIFHEKVRNANPQGIEAFLENHFYHTLGTLGVENPVTPVGVDLRAQLWLDTILRFKVESPSFRHAVYFYLQAVAEGDEAEKRLLGAWLRGESIALKEVREFSVT